MTKNNYLDFFNTACEILYKTKTGKDFNAVLHQFYLNAPYFSQISQFYSNKGPFTKSQFLKKFIIIFSCLGLNLMAIKCLFFTLEV